MEIYPATAYLWFSFLEEIQDEKLIAEYRRLLPSSERDKLGRYRFDRHKKRYLVGRALIRTVLSSCTGVAPDQITLAREAHGRPYLALSSQDQPLQFSLSYTDGLVAAAVVAEGRVGIDVEYISRNADCLEIAHKYFSPSEYTELQQLPDIQMKERFFELWTLKEAYMKACGLGLSLPLDEVSFTFPPKSAGPTEPASILMKDDESWQLRLLSPSNLHKAALCVCHNDDIPTKMIIKKTVPLVTEETFTMPED